MASIRKLKILLPLVVIVGLITLVGLLPTGTAAQGDPPLPTPTNIGAGGGGDGDGTDRSDATPVPPKAGVSGFVYDYSNAAYQGGVIVVIDGGGWQAEAVTDSNGYYLIGDLGTGMGIMNLRLPPGTTPVVFDWPIWLTSGAGLRVDLGYFWGDDPPMPVLLTARLTGNKLAIQLENRTSEVATGGLIEIRSPASIRVSPRVVISQGKVVSYDSHRFQIEAGDIFPGESAASQIWLEANLKAARKSDQASSAIQVIFTYDQQFTPQVLDLEINDLSQAIMMTSPDVSRSDPVVTDQEFSPQEVLATSVSPARSQDQTQSTSVKPSATRELPSPSPAPSAPLQPQQQNTTPNQMTSRPTGEAPLPVTGITLNSTGITKMSFSAFLLLALSLAGWWSFKANK